MRSFRIAKYYLDPGPPTCGLKWYENIIKGLLADYVEFLAVAMGIINNQDDDRFQRVKIARTKYSYLKI